MSLSARCCKFPFVNPGSPGGSCKKGRLNDRGVDDPPLYTRIPAAAQWPLPIVRIFPSNPSHSGNWRKQEMVVSSGSLS